MDSRMAGVSALSQYRQKFGVLVGFRRRRDGATSSDLLTLVQRVLRGWHRFGFYLAWLDCRATDIQCKGTVH